ncbi:MAG TPA: enoyl-CoA hydratase-related protein [Solirubrobacterales bacterium]
MAVTEQERGSVRVLTIDRPKVNAIDLATGQELSATFDRAEADPEVAAIVITGAGDRVFCAGMDLDAVKAGQAAEINGVPGGFGGIVKRDCAKPVIAAVNGAAMGGGFEIVLACDMVVAAETARLALPEVTQGLLAASGGAVRLPARLPAVVAMRHLLLGDPIDAARAYELGLVNQLTPAGGALDAAVELATRVVANPPAAVRAAKRVARTVLGAGESDAWRLSDDLAAELSAAYAAGDLG